MLNLELGLTNCTKQKKLGSTWESFKLKTKHNKPMEVLHVLENEQN
jgi:hypothetical protein